mmetsp:Transcript_26138/g.31808  ORF Transcript_26138/g.31808 Transcript_26138/m.31808 type:complete len:114 (-) Transcript_26138:283-624(-)
MAQMSCCGVSANIKAVCCGKNMEDPCCVTGNNEPNPESPFNPLTLFNKLALKLDISTWELGIIMGFLLILIFVLFRCGYQCIKGKKNAIKYTKIKDVSAGGSTSHGSEASSGI